jgi:hypothetical protein
VRRVAERVFWEAALKAVNDAAHAFVESDGLGKLVVEL